MKYNDSILDIEPSEPQIIFERLYSSEKDRGVNFLIRRHDIKYYSWLDKEYARDILHDSYQIILDKYILPKKLDTVVRARKVLYATLRRKLAEYKRLKADEIWYITHTESEREQMHPPSYYYRKKYNQLPETIERRKEWARSKYHANLDKSRAKEREKWKKKYERIKADPVRYQAYLDKWKKNHKK